MLFKVITFSLDKARKYTYIYLFLNILRMKWAEFSDERLILSDE